MEEKIQQLSQKIGYLTDTLNETRSNLWKNGAEETKLKNLDTIIYQLEDVQNFLKTQSSYYDKDLTVLQTKLQSLTNQGAFELRQLKSVEQTLNTLTKFKSKEITAEECVQNIFNDRADVASVVKIFAERQKKLNVDIQSAADCYNATQNVLAHPHNKLSEHYKDNGKDFKSELEQELEIETNTNNTIATINSNMMPLLDELEFQIGQISHEAESGELIKDEFSGKWAIELPNKVPEFKRVYTFCQDILKGEIKGTFEEIVSQKFKKIEKQLKIFQSLGVSEEFYSKLKEEIGVQMLASASIVPEIQSFDADYKLPAEMIDKFKKIAEQTENLTAKKVDQGLNI